MKSRNPKRTAVCIDSDPDIANWLRIVRAERIARKNVQARQIWEAAIKDAGGSRSDALLPFFERLRAAGISED